ARVAVGRRAFDQAIAIYYLILKDHPNDPNAHMELAEAYVAQGDVSDGIFEYDRALAINPKNGSVYNNLGLIYARDGESDRAIAAYKKAIAFDPNLVAAYLNLANVEFQSGKFAEARQSLEDALRIDPHNYIIWMNYGVMATATGNLDSGELCFRTAIYYNSRSSDACLNLGMVLLRQSDRPKAKSRVNEAIGYFKRALALDPKNARATANLAAAERRRDRENNE
ncbi:MAG: tetratricopeptide repeat protein, partial [Phycisphaerae bacterium]|nr:tetratricopeptide repeat protein [Phycisphaerae bacterium]